MALESIAAMLTAITGSDETRRLILAQAIDKSQVDVLKPGLRFTSPVVRGGFISQIEAYARSSDGVTKATTSGVNNAVNFTTKPIAIIVPVDNLYSTSQKDLQQALIDQMVAGLARGIDRNILRDAEGVYGTSVAEAAVAASNTKSAASATAITYAEMSDTFALVEADGFQVNGVMVREASKGALRTAETTGGNRFWWPAAQGAPENIFGAPVVFGSSYSPDGTSGAVLPASATTGETVAVVGDWNQLLWGIYGEDFQVAINPWAEPYFSRNQTLVRVEVYMGYQVLNNNAFAVLLEP